MPGTVTTADANGLGYQQGYFSGPINTPLAQDFFNAAFAGRIHADPIFKEAFNCNIVQQCTMSTWLDEFMGFETDCFPAYNLIETNGQYHQIRALSTSTIPTNPSVGTIALDTNSQFVGGLYVLPQVGNTIVLAPLGVLAEVTAVNLTTHVISVVIRDTAATAQVVTAQDVMPVLTGSFIADCACPTGGFRFDDLPIIRPLSMQTFGDKGSLCGDALLKCQYLKIPFTDDCGNVIEKWYTKALQDMYRDHEFRKHFERLLNPIWGIIPTLKARGIKFTPASSTEITTDDVRDWKAALDLNGISCREYAIFAGGPLFSQWQRMLLTAGVVQLNYLEQPLGSCKWIDMNYCGISVEGLKLWIYEECSFSNGKLLGGPHMTFQNSAIMVPMCDRQTNCRGGYDQKMLTTVYFKDNTGRVWDNLTDSNGVLGLRNTFGTGCEQQEWSIKTRMVQEVHCPNSWGYMGLN